MSITLVPTATAAFIADLTATDMQKIVGSRLVARAEASVSVSSDVMGGEPVFRGTRVPIANVAASKRAGIDLDELQEAYPFLTPERIEDAETYQTIHPKVGRPRKEVAGEVTAERRKLISREVVALPPRRS